MLKNKIITLITDKIKTHHIEIDDYTEKHKNHSTYDNGRHFKLLIISDDFKNISLLNRHKTIYNILNKMIKNEIHALSLKTFTIQEFKENKRK